MGIKNDILKICARVSLVFALGIFSAFFVMVAIAARQRAAIVSDISELLIVGVGVIFFVISVLLQEYQAKCNDT